MRPLHKKLIDQFQMMRASLYHVSDPAGARAAQNQPFLPREQASAAGLWWGVVGGGVDEKLLPPQRARRQR